MFVACVIVSVLLAALLGLTAARKLSHREDVVQAYARVGVPEDRLDYLAMILIAGAAGLLQGLLWAPIGIAAASGLVVYFVLAIAAHIRFGDTGSLPTPLAMESMALAALVLRFATL